MTSPETRPSLLLRVRDANDTAAWDEFVQIYQPVIHRLARRKGLQTADADDLVQRVLWAMSKAVDCWEPDKNRGRFRTWLHTVANNAILNALTRGAQHRGTGGDEAELLLQKIPAPNHEDSALLRTECRREIFHHVAAIIRNEFSHDTWNSFWLTAIDGVEVEAAAQQLGRSRGSVYASRSRVMKRLKQVVQEYTATEEESSGVSP